MKQNIFDNIDFFNKYIEHRKKNEGLNNDLEIPAFRKLLCNLGNKKILDIGCGFGDNAKFCIRKGAKSVDAIDISKNMINQAKKTNYDSKITYSNLDIETFNFTSFKYDIVISSLAFHYIYDYNQLIVNIAKTLKNFGKLIFSIEHPISTSNKKEIGWITQDDEKLYWAFDDYHFEGLRLKSWFVPGVVKYHRTINTLISGLIGSGFMLTKFIEPLPIEITNEKLKNEYRRPRILIIEAIKNSL